MARVTVSDCREVVNNRFKLVLLAGQRAKDIASGAPLTVSRDNDKNPIVALREIAARTVDVDYLYDTLIRNAQKYGKTDPSLEEDDLLTEDSINHAEITSEFSALVQSDASEVEDVIEDSYEGEISADLAFEDDSCSEDGDD